jgi:hypothetical protein
MERKGKKVKMIHVCRKDNNTYIQLFSSQQKALFYWEKIKEKIQATFVKVEEINFSELNFLLQQNVDHHFDSHETHDNGRELWTWSTLHIPS